MKCHPPIGRLFCQAIKLFIFVREGGIKLLVAQFTIIKIKMNKLHIIVQL